jgi:hypothetical protein
VVSDPDTVTGNATHTDPVRPASAPGHMIVNGESVVWDGRWIGREGLGQVVT